MPRQKTVRAFEEWVQDEANVEEVLRRVMAGTKLSKLCAEIKRPYTLLYPFLHSTPELKARYEAALAGRADDLMHETLEIADGVKGAEEPAVVSAAKLRIETRQKIASGWNRERYGDTLRVEKTVTHTVDAGLVGTIGDLLKVGRRTPVTIENTPEQADPGHSSSPAPLLAPAVVER